jgi:hypothetical protein
VGYKYEMIQLPPNIQINASSETGSEAADYLQRIVNDHASRGWEFFRVDSIGVSSQPGCVEGLLYKATAGILGKKEEFFNYYVVTFRQEA